MDIQDIRAFLDVVSYASISEAARKRFVSQQTLSRRISQLEKEVGYRLLDRSIPITPTPAGRIFLRESGKVISAYDELIRATRSVGARPVSSVRVKSFGNSSFTMLFASTISHLSSTHPDVSIEYVTKNVEDIELIRAGQLDIGFVRDVEKDGVSSYHRADDMTYRRLASLTFPLTFAVHDNHPLTRLKQPTLRDIASYRISLSTANNHGALPLAILRLFRDECLPVDVEDIYASDMVGYYAALDPRNVGLASENDLGALRGLPASPLRHYVTIRPADARYEVMTYAICKSPNQTDNPSITSTSNEVNPTQVVLDALLLMDKQLDDVIRP